MVQNALVHCLLLQKLKYAPQKVCAEKFLPKMIIIKWITWSVQTNAKTTTQYYNVLLQQF